MDLFEKLGGFLEQILSGLLGLVIIGGSVVGVYMLFVIMFSQDPAKKTQYKDHIKLVVICVVGALLFRGILEWVGNYFLG